MDFDPVVLAFFFGLFIGTLFGGSTAVMAIWHVQKGGGNRKRNH